MWMYMSMSTRECECECECESEIVSMGVSGWCMNGYVLCVSVSDACERTCLVVWMGDVCGMWEVCDWCDLIMNGRPLFPSQQAKTFQSMDQSTKVILRVWTNHLSTSQDGECGGARGVSSLCHEHSGIHTTMLCTPRTHEICDTADTRQADKVCVCVVCLLYVFI